ncbi:MAG: glycogen synthase GlgA [Dehalococcoidia bacterium]|nr:MAG: glycogen synthase GlgA [Dehalococcoidia bacterium]
MMKDRAALRVAIASPEIAPFAKTGGLGDVLGALPKALAKLGLKVSLIMPAYRRILQSEVTLEDSGVRFTVPVYSRNEEATLLTAKMGGIPVYLVRADRYFDRDHLYGDAAGDYPDNAERFAFFSRAILEVLKLVRPAILHANDWQSAPAVVFLKTQPEFYSGLSSVRTVLTVHNPGYQGIFESRDLLLLNLDDRLTIPRYLEFYGKINFLKGGLVLADKITTVSPSYAEEIKTEEQGFGLDGIFRERAGSLSGILNGADYDVWNPETDRLIAQNYSLGSLGGKQTCKTDLQRVFKLGENPDMPLVGMVARLSAQKGFDLLEEAIDRLFSRKLQFVLLGTGDKRYQDFFSKALAKYPGKAGIGVCFDETLAHKVIAGADFFLMPSRYEPGGLTQLYSLKYGTIPIVRAVGGLKDSIRDFSPSDGSGNGIVFTGYDAPSLIAAVDRALALFGDKENRQALIKNAMAADFSWENAARAYRELYRSLMG